MGKKAPQAPTPPDPAVVAAAQTKSNQDTAQYQQKLNMVSQYGPDGSVTWSADPNAPGGYAQTTTLSPGQQGIYDASTEAQKYAAQVARDQIIRLNGALQKPLTEPTLQYAPNAPTFQRIKDGPQYQESFDYDGSQRFVDPRYDDSGAVMAAMYGQAASRLDPMWGQRQDRLETQLANQGLDRNSTAYQTAMGDFGRDRNDAYNQAIYSAITGGADRQNQLFGQGLSEAQLYNQGVGQDYTQNMGAAGFLNDARARGYGDYLNQTQTNNQYSQQEYDNAFQNAAFNNSVGQQALQNEAYIQNQPLNQFGALMSNSQVAMPQGFGYSPTSVAGTNVAGIYQNDFQNRSANYQQQASNRSSMLGGLFGLGGAVLSAGTGGVGSSIAGSVFNKVFGG